MQIYYYAPNPPGSIPLKPVIGLYGRPLLCPSECNIDMKKFFIFYHRRKVQNDLKRFGYSSGEINHSLRAQLEACVMLARGKMVMGDFDHEMWLQSRINRDSNEIALIKGLPQEARIRVSLNAEPEIRSKMIWDDPEVRSAAMFRDYQQLLVQFTYYERQSQTLQVQNQQLHAQQNSLTFNQPSAPSQDELGLQSANPSLNPALFR